MVCLDTTFLIDFLRGRENTKLLKDKFEKNEETLTITSPSVIELIKGLKIGKVRENEERKVKELISSLPVLELDKESAILAGDLEGDLINKGNIIDLEDIMISAIVIKNNEKLITKNLKHFEKIKDLNIENY